MGRLIAVVVFVALLVPGVLLARAWARAADRRAVAGGAVEFAEPTPEGTAVLTQQAQHGQAPAQGAGPGRELGGIERLRGYPNRLVHGVNLFVCG